MLQVVKTIVTHLKNMHISVKYTEREAISSGDCQLCYCCTVCFEQCRCQKGLDTPSGMFSLLKIEIPRDYENVKNYVQLKIKEEKSEESESDDDAEDSQEDTEESLEDSENEPVNSDNDAGHD